MRIAWVFLVLACTGWAQGVQNMEFMWMAGGGVAPSSTIAGLGAVIPGGPSITAIAGPVISGSAGFAMQIGWAYQLPRPRAGYLWLEVPTTHTWLGTGMISGATVASIDRNSWFLTPGIRLKTPTYGRVSFYGAAGGGFGSFSKVDSTIRGANGTVLVNSGLQISPAFDFGGGIDLRLSRRLSLRAEGRDFVSAPNLGGVNGHNHAVGLIGLVFHL